MKMTEKVVKVEAPAKVNFTLELLGLMEDGYHRVKTLMQTVSLSDTLTFKISPAREPSIELSVEGKPASDFPLSQDNLICKAVRLFLSSNLDPEKAALNPLKISVHVEKRIPIGAGTAGGSGNAAAALLALNEYFDRPFTRESLAEMGKKLGADVPFSLLGGTMVGLGRGDELQSIGAEENFQPLYLVLAKSRNLSVPTVWAYKTYDECPEVFGLSERTKDRGITDDATAYAAEKLAAGELTDAIKVFGNDFEQAIFPHYKELKAIKQRFMQEGALTSHMTGSGPTVYAVCRTQEEAEKLKRDYEEGVLRETTISCAAKSDPVDLFVCMTTPHGARILDNES